MQTRRWINQSQPQTLVIAVFLLYFDAAADVLFSGGAVLLSPFVVLVVAGAAAGYGIANEKKWGYYLALAIAVLGLLPYVFALLGGSNVLGGMGMIGLLFAVAKFA